MQHSHQKAINLRKPLSQIPARHNYKSTVMRERKKLKQQRHKAVVLKHAGSKYYYLLVPIT